MKKIVQLILALVIVGLVYVIYDQISTPIRFENVKKAKEEAVIERIKDIRTAERAFKSKYQHFTGDFDTLINFVLNDSIEGQRRIVDEDDSVAMAQLKKAGKKNIETFTVAVIDTIFAPKKLSPDQVKNFRYIPGTNKQAEFTIAAGMATGLDRSFAVRFSFLMSLPAVLGANILALAKAAKTGIDVSLLPAYLVGMLVAMASGIVAIGLVKRLTSKGHFGAFSYYCWGAGAVTMLLSLIF